MSEDMQAAMREQDVHHVRPVHGAIHERLDNWARWVRYSTRSGTACQPMFRQYRSYRGWHPVVASIEVDTVDAARIERAVTFLPEKHREALRWWYVYSEAGMSVWKACRALGVQKDTLLRLVHDARSMLKNRLDMPAGTTLRIRPQFDPAPAVPLSRCDAEPSLQ